MTDLRAQIEKVLVERHGEVSQWHAVRLFAALNALEEVGRAMRRRDQAERDGTMTDERWLTFRDRIVRHPEVAARAFKDLGLDRDQAEIGRDPKELADGAAHNEILTFEERREFWTTLRQALIHVPEAYEAVNRLLASRVKENERRRNAELGQRETVG
jgi:hypothetical protein